MRENFVFSFEGSSIVFWISWTISFDATFGEDSQSSVHKKVRGT